MDKPVVALIVGRSVPPGKQMGHAGALIAREEHGADAKREALRRAGALVADTLWDVPELAARALSGRRA
jgi:succinyl-CoA synthetase alpha subunit